MSPLDKPTPRWRRPGIASAAALLLVAAPALAGTAQADESSDVNVLVRGQSNALVFADQGGAAELETALEDRLGADVHLLHRWGDDTSTIHSGTAFMDWDADGRQAGLVRYLQQLPDDLRDNPTLTLWMHNEYDQKDLDLTTEAWTGEVRADAQLVREALGQHPGTTPYLFVPIRYPYGANWDAIGDGMAALDADASFNADISWAAQDLVMDGDGAPDSSHMGAADAADLGRSLAPTVAERLAPLSTAGASEPAQLEVGSGPDSLVLQISQDAYEGDAEYTVAVDGAQVGGTLTASALRSAGAVDTVTVRGDWATGDHQLDVTFTNDLYGGTPETDRNLHVESATYDGTALGGTPRTLFSAETASFGFVDSDSGWELAYEDEFTGGDLNTAVFDRIQGVSSHSKVQWVHDNVHLEDGAVTLRVDTTENEAGAFTTQNSLVQTYGKYEVRARMEEGAGTGMALLLWPQSQQWPADGEIDFGETPRRDSAWQVNHYQAADGSHQQDAQQTHLDATQWHTYGVEWTPQALTFSIDGQPTMQITDPARIPDGPMFLGMQTEYMGDCTNGDWIPCPDASTPATVRAQIDSVRIWSLT